MVKLRTRPDTSHQMNIKPQKVEPATDDEPLSSSDEEKYSEYHPKGSVENTPKARPAGSTLREKLSAKPPGSARKRTTKDIFDCGRGDNDEDNIFGIRSSQTFKRRRPGYGRKSDSFQKWPSSSMESPSSSVPPLKSKSAEPEDKKGGSKGEFKVPVDIDVLSPPSKTRFKQPPPLPPGSISSSSLVASSNIDKVFDTDDDDDSSLSSAMSFSDFDIPVDDEILGKTQPQPQSQPEKTEYLCPMCKEPVLPELLIRFQAQPKQRIRDQQRFCESHKKSSAEKEWQDKGYPTINWAQFDERIRSHFNELEKLLVPGSSSYYRNVLDSMLKSGQAKNFRLTLSGDALETISCGYYGTRGSGKMLQAITDRFSRKLRRLAADDHIVKKAGVVVYSQAVLVPELAVKLVKEDMGVNDESARHILRDSIEIGEKLNFALNDSVPIVDEEANLPN